MKDDDCEGFGKFDKKFRPTLNQHLFHCQISLIMADSWSQNTPLHRIVWHNDDINQ